MSKAPNPQLLSGRHSVGCPLLHVCVHLDGLNAERTHFTAVILCIIVYVTNKAHLSLTFFCFFVFLGQLETGTLPIKLYLLHRKKIDIYAHISLFLSYSEVTVATRSGPYPAQMFTAVTRSSPYPDQMMDQHLETTSTAPTALNVSRV